jgi:hypothetical protein
MSMQESDLLKDIDSRGANITCSSLLALRRDVSAFHVLDRLPEVVRNISSVRGSINQNTSSTPIYFDMQMVG